MTELLLSALAIYLAIGVMTTIVLSQTPYADNPWWVTTLLWPVFLRALFFGP